MVLINVRVKNYSKQNQQHWLILKLLNKVLSKMRKKKRKKEKLKTFDSSYFQGKRHFKDGETQNYLIVQPVF